MWLIRATAAAGRFRRMSRHLELVAEDLLSAVMGRPTSRLDLCLQAPTPCKNEALTFGAPDADPVDPGPVRRRNVLNSGSSTSASPLLGFAPLQPRAPAQCPLGSPLPLGAKRTAWSEAAELSSPGPDIAGGSTACSLPRSRPRPIPAAPSSPPPQSASPRKRATAAFPPLEKSPGSLGVSAISTPMSGQDAAGQPQMRLLLVRHAQSANKRRNSGEEASKDPGLSDLGLQQAEQLGHRLLDFLAERRVDRRSGLLVVSSPMLRCLLTIQPTVARLKLAPGRCICHGACFEYGCAGTEFSGSTEEDILTRFPDFQPVGFGAQGRWDYRGNSKKEEDSEFLVRGARIVKWLREEGLTRLRASSAEGPMPTLILTTHQTLGDLLCHLLVEGTADRWEYGSLRYRMQNAGTTEIFLHAGGAATFGQRHL